MKAFDEIKKKKDFVVGVGVVIVIVFVAIAIGIVGAKYFKSSLDDKSVAYVTTTTTTKATTTRKSDTEYEIPSETVEETFNCNCHRDSEGKLDNEIQSENTIYGIFCSEECELYTYWCGLHQINSVNSVSSFNGNITIGDITIEEGGTFNFVYGQNDNKQSNEFSYVAIVGDYNTISGMVLGHNKDVEIKSETDEKEDTTKYSTTTTTVVKKPNATTTTTTKKETVTTVTTTTKEPTVVTTTITKKPTKFTTTTDKKVTTLVPTITDKPTTTTTTTKKSTTTTTTTTTKKPTTTTTTTTTKKPTTTTSDYGFDIEPMNPPKIAWEYDASTKCLVASVYLRSETDEFELSFMDGQDEIGGFYLTSKTAVNGVGKTFKFSVMEPKNCYVKVTNSNGEITKYYYKDGNFQ